MRFLVTGHGVIGANIPPLAAPYKRGRLEVAGQPSAMSDRYVPVFSRGDGRYLGRRNVLVEDGHPMLVPPGCRPLGGGSGISLNRRRADARFVPA